MTTSQRIFYLSFTVMLICSCASTSAAGKNSAAGNIPAPVSVPVVAEKDVELEYVELPPLVEGLPVSSFNEIWAYVTSGAEAALKANLPISDVVYFGAEVDRYGKLVNVPKRVKLGKYAGRVHVSVACFSAGLIHFTIQPGTKARSALIEQIVAAAQEYDGLNIDYENVPGQDGEAFLSFISEIRSRLSRDKTFSVCVPARTKSSGVYDYGKIAFLSDRVFVMAYDEHWSTSKPGPVASMNWCRDVAAYALKAIGAEKLIMGVPFYGRAWGNTSTSRALVAATTERIRREYGIEDVKRANGIPTFTYDVLVKVTVFYEDEYSIATRLDMYRKQGVRAAGFWRLGQETMAVWPTLNLDTHVAVR